MGLATSDRVAGRAAESADLFNRIAPLTPCYRRGAVLQAVATTAAARRPIRRDAFQARELGMALVEREADIHEGVKSAIAETATKLGLKICSLQRNEGEIMSRFAPGLILDFPPHEFVLGRMTIRERSCVTVCYNDAASKIWTRFIVSDVSDDHVTKEELRDFYRFARDAAQAARGKLERVYLDLFRFQHRGSSSVEFDELGVIEFLGVDTDALHLDNYVYTDSIGPVLGSPNIYPEDKRAFVSFFRDNLEIFLPHRLKRGHIKNISEDTITVFRSMFDYRALYHGIFSEKIITFLVLSEPGREVASYGRRESGALTIISELAARAVGRF